MTDQHPITPSLELVQQWTDEIYGGPGVVAASDDICLAKLAAQWGYQQAVQELEAFLRKSHDTMKTATELAQQIADQELEACCRELEYNFMPDSGSLRTARRPKPSLKEQVCKLLESHLDDSGVKLTTSQRNTTRRTLKDSNDCDD